VTAPVTDADLMAAHVAGDPHAFGELFARHRQRLWAVALRTLGDPEEAADALQDALISAFRRAESFRGDAAVTTWLHRIVVNACLDRARRAKVRAVDPLPDDDPEFGGRGSVLTADVEDPATITERSQLSAAVLLALSRLPMEQRMALVLVDLQGHSVESAAHILECAPGTVKSRCSRGRARLAPLLADWREGNQDGSPRVSSTSDSRGMQMEQEVDHDDRP
jgi:RNA polymerase sigma-70 factor (ECF subfamily)